MKKVIIDVDTGIDDALAMIYALHSPELDILGFTTCFGNNIVYETTRNTLRVLELVGRTDIPVFPGAAEPLSRVNRKQLPIAIHGFDGLADVKIPDAKVLPLSQPASTFIVEQVKKFPGEITLITLGTLTNVALAIKEDPELVTKVKNVAVMGGAVLCPGNVTPAAEANIYADPEAAQFVFQSGIPIMLVGLDVTMQTLLPRACVEEWRSIGTELSTFLADISDFYMDAYLKRYPSINGCALHDPLVVGAVIDSTFVKTFPMYVEVDTEGEQSVGRTVADREPNHPPANMQVCLEVDSERFTHHFLKRII